MGDISNSTRDERVRTIAGTLGAFAGVVAVAASALAYTLYGPSEEAPFLSAGAQPVRTAATPGAPSFETIPSEVGVAAPRAVDTPAPADAKETPTTLALADDVAPATPVPSDAAASSVAPVAPSTAPPFSVASASPPPPPAPLAIATPGAPVSAPAPPPATSAPAPPPPTPPIAAAALSGREQGLVDAMNERRSAAGLSPLLVSSALTGVARTRSSDMLANSYFAHSSPSGQTWYSLLSSLGLSYSAGGENLAKVSGDTSSSVGLAIEALMASPTHRANILNPAYRLVGVGGAVQGDTLTILTSVFTDR